MTFYQLNPPKEDKIFYMLGEICSLLYAGFSGKDNLTAEDFIPKYESFEVDIESEITEEEAENQRKYQKSMDMYNKMKNAIDNPKKVYK